MTDYESVARQRLTIERRREPEPIRFAECLLICLGVPLIVLGVYLLTVMILSLS